MAWTSISNLVITDNKTTLFTPLFRGRFVKIVVAATNYDYSRFLLSRYTIEPDGSYLYGEFRVAYAKPKDFIIDFGNSARLLGEAGLAVRGLASIVNPSLSLNVWVWVDSELVEFTNSSLSSGKLIVTHNLGTYHIDPILLDNNGNYVIADWRAINPNQTELDLTPYGTIPGTWKLSIRATSWMY